MKRLVVTILCGAIVAVLTSCGTPRKGMRADDPYLYKRGPWCLNKGGILDDIPQFLWQMTESMFDCGTQPVDPPSVYENAAAAGNSSI